MPRKNTARLACAAPVVLPKASPSIGKAGRYMSIENGPIAAMAPRMNGRRFCGMLTPSSFRCCGERFRRKLERGLHCLSPLRRKWCLWQDGIAHREALDLQGTLDASGK